MSHSMCLRCLSRSIQQLEQPLSRFSVASRAPFSTSPVARANPTQKKKGTPEIKHRSGSGLRIRKNVRASTGKPPAPGERKAIRKRIVLSNANALEVPGLKRFHKGNATSERLSDLKGDVLAFDDKTIDKLRALEAFKVAQNWSLFKTASTLIREDTVHLARAIEQAESSRASTSLILHGERGSGKSVLQLQAMCMAQHRGWILIHFPEAHEIVVGTTAYQPASDTTSKTLYTQPHYTAKLLSNVYNANKDILGNLRLSKEHKLPIPIPTNISLARLIELGSRDPSIAWPIWEVVLQELTIAPQEGEGLHRPPLMLSLDGLAHIMKPSEYVDAELNSIHAHELALVSLFIDYLNGSRPMQSGGLVLAATSASNQPASPTLNFVLAERYAESKQLTKPVWDPYAERDSLVDEALKGVQAHKLGGLTKEEAKSAIEYYALSGIFRDRVTDELVAEKWSVSGGGIMGELEKSCIRQRF